MVTFVLIFYDGDETPVAELRFTFHQNITPGRDKVYNACFASKLKSCRGIWQRPIKI